jgi:membrane fusion protein (multidrug efflux system)
MTNQYHRKTMRVPWRLRMRRLLRGCFLLVVIALIPYFLWLQTQDPSTYRFSGLVEAETETVGPVENARILSVEVQVGQRVKPGDVLVRLDPSDRAVEQAMNEARLKDYEQGALRYAQGADRYRQTLQESERRARQTLQEASVALEAEKMNRARDEAELLGLKAEIARLQPLVDRRLVSETELSSLRPNAQALEQAVAQYAPLIEALQQQRDQASADLQEVQKRLAAASSEGSAADPILVSLRQAAESYRQAAAKDPAVLLASRAGLVSRVLRQPGDVVVAGEPIVRVAAAGSLYITGLLTQRQLEGVSVGDKLRVTRTANGRQAALTAQVELVEPEVMDLLDPFNPVPRYPVRGRRVRLRVLDENNTLVPGETVSLESGRRETWLEGVKRICFFSGCRTASL